MCRRIKIEIEFEMDAVPWWQLDVTANILMAVKQKNKSDGPQEGWRENIDIDQSQAGITIHAKQDIACQWSTPQNFAG